MLSSRSRLSSAPSRPLPGPEENRLSSLVALLMDENGRLLKVSQQEQSAMKSLEASMADREAELVVLNRRLAVAELADQHGGGRIQLGHHLSV